MTELKKIDKKDFDYFTEEGELVIKNRIALRDINKDEVLVSYGKTA
jgi:hypothetical protein